MKIGGIDNSQITAMVAQLKAAAARMESSAPVAGTGASVGLSAGASTAPAKLDFADALKGALDQVNATGAKAEEVGKQFTMGSDNVGLSDVMISMQKANISFQAAVQVRNRLVSAYHDIMNMQI
ncbi:flagellar hook-basal body complex protein FliE [Undibacterium sp. RTI2.1]|uniref:flagellar hook-basal body complex protein FliE n=1 Tax=unclassified Undibacterium TaxID=2630295 RepID=UPI002AB50E24|nr:MULTISPECIES: flagellar hook-basal body complex protein FliE [unclassified Undibacterium]MDY7537125.1 flagellar hook-basal body complex protein FliE [Undibacterium sp. 5I1]MEB0029836.1 flagellar hook-basal body complex protein FliE [Undibacterium sp. RTI2.1]MEB0115121.1 flagellar hook-basal body complex protein FliE [Undibacterium sp. RTI2.2]MEB0229303.1 flagellar hook-basal body complex protein FliE [Undibacterium sp. 10I3]MEB0256149.1 flagellar hook-basal body complex protein FliE [Undiba